MDVMKKRLMGRLLGGVLLAVAMCGIFDLQAGAAETEPEITLSTGKSSAGLRDSSYGTAAKFNAGDTIDIKAADGSLLSGIYIIWDSPAQPWTLSTDTGTYSCGENGYLHEYIALDTPAAWAVVQIPCDDARICEIRSFGEGELPEDVQVWEPVCDRADIMMIASHSDDDILFMGGIIPTYGVAQGADVQVVFLTEFWSSTRIREHEKLDGLWEDGLKHYPLSGEFPDLYAENLKQAESQHDADKITGFLVEQLRRFQPQVVVTHDLNGEYGHGFHMLTAKAVTDAVEKAAQESAYSESADVYGVWNTPKTYLHLFQENSIHMNLRIPIEEMGGRTALEVATDAYKKHVSQQWCWFYVSDENKYSCADFGLYRTNVGVDKNNDMLENIKLYSVQEKEEAERLAAEEAERLAAQQAAREAAERRAAGKEAFRETGKSVAAEMTESLETVAADIRNHRKRRMIAGVTGAGIITVSLVGVLYGRKRRK